MKNKRYILLFQNVQLSRATRGNFFLQLATQIWVKTILQTISVQFLIYASCVTCSVIIFQIIEMFYRRRVSNAVALEVKIAVGNQNWSQNCLVKIRRIFYPIMTSNPMYSMYFTHNTDVFYSIVYVLSCYPTFYDQKFASPNPSHKWALHATLPNFTYPGWKPENLFAK